MSSESDYERMTVEPTDSRGRARRLWDTLQDALRQPVETVTRQASFNATSGDTEDIDPPEDIDEFIQLWEDVGFIRKNISEYGSDVMEPGIRVTAEDDTTEAYFMGGDDAPESAPEGGFVTEAYVIDEKRQHANRGARNQVREKWRRGTAILVRTYDDPNDPESKITGFTHVRPETLSARTYENSNQLLDPDPDSPANQGVDLDQSEFTRRDEAPAFIQFDEQAILAQRGRATFDDKTSIPLSQNDIYKQTLDQDIGGPDPEDGVFGVSIIRSIKDPAEEYRDMNRDEANAIKRIAYGLHTAQFNDYILENPDGENVLIQWDDDDIQSAESDIENAGPGTVITTDAQVDLERFQPDLPDLDKPMRRRIREIIDPLPAPYYKHSFADDINQFVTEPQQEDYQEQVSDERNEAEELWTEAFADVAERHDDLDPSGLSVSIEPDEDESPILSLSTEQIEAIEKLSGALNDLSGQLSPVDVFGEETIRELVAMLPEDEDMDTMELDEDDVDVAEQFNRVMKNDD